MTALQLFTSIRMRLEDELPQIERQAKEGFVGTAAPFICRERIKQFSEAETIEKARLGNPA